jgi:hypothetical protein
MYGQARILIYEFLVDGGNGFDGEDNLQYEDNIRKFRQIQDASNVQNYRAFSDILH